MKRIRMLATRILLLAPLFAVAACTHTVKVEPIKVEPIDITLHIYLEADEKLDSFFDYQNEPAASPADTPATNANPISSQGALS